ncbi:MAG: hypothetical protein ACLQBK_05375 [Candidatus Sulfotelmatobacter sp.]
MDDFKSNFAALTVFSRVFEVGMERLFLLAFLLSPHHMLAEDDVPATASGIAAGVRSAGERPQSTDDESAPLT